MGFPLDFLFISTTTPTVKISVEIFTNTSLSSQKPKSVNANRVGSILHTIKQIKAGGASAC